ncbi:hypothetical protein BASA83_005933 [Batrachochytrium salamandrivorans]|nr:hypothetical protein BASA83_005933 [Batrachochytrium salamandrivorans]
MKHPVLGVLSILSISVYAATLPGHVDNAPLLVKRQVYPEDSPADSMNQSPESVGEPFDFSPSELGMMQTDANPSTPDSHGDPDINTDPSTPDSHGDPDSNADPSTSDSHGDPDSNADPSTSNSHGNPGSDTNLSTLGVLEIVIVIVVVIQMMAQIHFRRSKELLHIHSMDPARLMIWLDPVL